MSSTAQIFNIIEKKGSSLYFLLILRYEAAMTRPLRIEYDGAWYHVLNRGLEKRQIFLNDGDQKRFLALLGEISETFGIEIHAYSLMGNHYHLLVHTPKAGLSRAMRHLNGVYTQKFNKAHDRDGPLFRGRYKALLIDSDEHLLTVARYVHLNPVKAGFVRDPKDHGGTSHQHYLRLAGAPSWLKTGEILSRFGTGIKAVRGFENFVSGANAEADDGVVKGRNGIIGSEGFRKWAYDNFVSETQKRDDQIPIREKKMKNKPSIAAFLKNIAFAFDVPDSVLRTSKRRVYNDARVAAAYLLRCRFGLPLAEIASHLNLSNANSAGLTIHRAKVRIEKEQNLSRLINQIPLENAPFGSGVSIRISKK